ncbi:type IV secretion system DNA-binding domain-containing protein [Acidiferrimicrobium sp. IK]|nr:type IV secretion system DNA-binding domain-containing protein [Acidiferrimicrobium sp. IK]
MEVDPARSVDVAAILDKAAQPCWAVAFRYGVATDQPGRQSHAAGRAHAIASAFAVYSGRNHLDRHRLRRPPAVLAARRLGRGNLPSVAELAALAHLPSDQTVAGLAPAGAKAVAPPPAVAQLARPAGTALPGTGLPAGSRAPDELKILGDAETGSRRPVALAAADARHHLHLMGATGSGKSTLLTKLVLSDVEAGRGVVVIDPKGDLVTDLCDRLPAGAEARTVLIDPAERHAPPVLNVLAGPDPDLVVDNLVGIFRNIFAAYWGPRTDDVLRAACLTLRHTDTEDAPASLADVPRLLSDACPQGRRRCRRRGRSRRVLALVRRARHRRPEPGRRPAHEQAPGVPVARLRPPGRRPRPLQHRRRPGIGRRGPPRTPAQRPPRRRHRPPPRQLHRRRRLAGRHPPGPPRPGRPGRLLPLRRRTPRTAPQLRRAPRRGPGLPPLPRPQPTSTSPSCPRAARRGQLERPHQGLVLHESRGRPRPRPPRRPRAERARPRPPRRLPGRRPPRRRRPGDPRLHASHPPRSAPHTPAGANRCAPRRSSLTGVPSSRPATASASRSPPRR